MIKTRLKAVLYAFAFCISTLPLTACHGAKALPAFEIPEEFDTTRSYEITFWAKNDTNKAQTDIYHKAIEDFQALYPNITVNMRLYTDYGRIYNDVITNISTQTTPNVCITYPDHIATYMSGTNIVVPLDELFDNAKYGFAGSEIRYDAPTRSEVIPKFLEECKLGEDYYAIPYMRSTEALYINKTYVEKLGYKVPEAVTWDFVFEVSEAAMKKDADGNFLINGQKVMIPFIYKSTDNMMIQMLKQKNAGYSTTRGEIKIFNDTTREILETVARHAKTEAFSTFKISSYPANFLNAGQCIFAVDSTAGATWMGSNAPLADIAKELFVDFETVVKPIPQFDTNNPTMISQGPSICVFNKNDPQEVLASWIFAQFLLTNDVQTAYAETEGYVPVTSKATDSEEYTDYLNRRGEDNSEHYDIKIDASTLLLDNIDNTFITPVFNGSASLRDAAGQLIESTTKSVRRNETIDDAYFAKLYDDTASLYHLNQGTAVNEGDGEVADLGPLPGTAVALLATLAGVWVLIIVFFVIGQLRLRKKTKI